MINCMASSVGRAADRYNEGRGLSPTSRTNIFLPHVTSGQLLTFNT